MKIYRRLDRALTALLRVELLLVAFATAASMIVASLLPLAVAAMGAMLLVRAISAFLKNGQLRISHTPADVPLIVLTSTLLVTLWVTPRMDITLPQVLRVITGIGLFLAIVNNARFITRHASLVVAGVALLGVMLVVSMPFTVEWSGMSKLRFIPASLYRGFTLVVSDGINPNVMAGAIVLLLPTSMAQLYRPSAPARKIFFALTVVIMLTGLLIAESRTAVFAAAASGLVLLILQMPRKLVGVLVLVVGLVALLYVASSRLFTWQIDAAVNRLFTTNDALSGSLSREEIWSRAAYLIQDFPLTGIGMGLFAPATDTIYPMLTMRPDIPHAHNLILQIAVDLGLPGLGSWLMLYAVVMVSLIEMLFRKPVEDRSLAIGLFGAQIAVAVGGITDSVTWGMVRSAPLIWGLWGISIACWLSTAQHSYTID